MLDEYMYIPQFRLDMTVFRYSSGGVITYLLSTETKGRAITGDKDLPDALVTASAIYRSGALAVGDGKASLIYLYNGLNLRAIQSNPI
ncbi:hypothetical protein GALMADRAFT_149053 [Galerina marginata CBS 339.88]|uniref:Uncharacterized protein n=1 Tax=Galerina marginata (strain CBS 339.88) TaxID=685588 RepID=A0A067S2N6_GALM3|nr:hypothetical protein GALMADRAFT_149053 [Galerina marginata CBS 339.88]